MRHKILGTAFGAAFALLSCSAHAQYDPEPDPDNTVGQHGPNIAEIAHTPILIVGPIISQGDNSAKSTLEIYTKLLYGDFLWLRQDTFAC